MAGLSAAVRAAEHGLKVVVLERAAEPDYLCNSRMTGGSFHICLTDILTDAGVLEAKINKVTAGAAHPALARAIAQDGRRAVKWLQGHGIRFIRGSPERHHNFVLSPPSLQRVGSDWKGRGGDVLLRTLESKLTKFGGKLLRGHRAQELRIEDGQCSGVNGLSNGTWFEVVAGSVVIADGGFQCDMTLVRDSISPVPEKVLQRNARSGHGDGVRMAKTAGAKLSSLVGFYGHVMNREAMTNSRLWPTPWMDNIATAAIVVGPDGQRFADEGRGGVYIANRIAALDDPLSATVIFDQSIWDGPGKSRFMPPNPNMEQQGGAVMKASSLKDLGEKLGLPPDALPRTVEEYNTALERGALETLSPARTPQTYSAMPVRIGPFYGVPVCAGITYTMGGIAIDEWSRAMKDDGTPFTGLYAAGGSSGGLEGGEEIGYVGGLVKAATTGLRAGEHIVRRHKAHA
ncbi:FAD-binding protein [Burkholderia pseudomallei]|nr:FAD-binding protein [Burkholderia pseudomallei]